MSLNSFISESIIINLKIICKIQKNNKIKRSKDGIISIENNGFYISIKRFLKNDSRKQSVTELNSIIEETFNIITKYKNNESEMVTYKDQIISMYNDLNNSVNGLENLKFTYNKDNDISTRLEILIEKIKIFIKNNNFI